MADDTAALKADIEKLRADFQALGRGLHDLLDKRGGRLRDRAEAGIAAAEERVDATVGSLLDEVKARPVTSLAVAFVVGLALGKMI